MGCGALLWVVGGGDKSPLKWNTPFPASLSAGGPQDWMRGPAQVAKQWKLPVLGVNFSYHSQTMLPVVWKKKLLQPAVLFTVGWLLCSSKWRRSQQPVVAKDRMMDDLHTVSK